MPDTTLLHYSVKVTCYVQPTTPCMSTIRLRCSRLMLKHGGNIPGVYIHVHRVSCGQLQAAHNARHVWTFIHAT
jgi:hypothetical protein